MANRINNRRYNKLLSYRNNYYRYGSQMQNDPYRLNGRYSTPAIVDGMGGAQNPSQGYKAPQPPSIKQPGLLGNLVETLKSGFQSGALNDASTAVGGMIGGAIGGGMSSGVGNTISSLGNIASAIPGPWGAVAGAGLNVIGGLTNRMFGSKMNKENIAKVEGTINRLNSFQSDASNFDTLADTWGSTAMGNNFSNKYIGKDGWFSHKAKKKARKLREQMELANAFAENTLQNNADNITETTMNNLEANYAALGGFLNQYADGGGIYINPKNRGKFNATKERTGKTTEELTHSKNPLTRKRAIFAQNAAKWHHAFGGELNTNGGDFSTGLMFIDEGGTHESNPYEGVPMGVAPDGKPNLVEEGEAIYNDYVFSNRLTVPKAIRNKYKLRGTKDLTFADAVKQISKNATERPNDSISQETLHEIMSDLAQTQEGVREEAHEGNRFDTGGFTYKPYKYVAGYNGGWFDSDGNYTKDYLDKVNSMNIADINNAFNEQYKFYSNDANKGTDRWKAIDAFYTANPQYKVSSTNLTDAALPSIRKLATDGNPGFMHQFFNDATPIKRANRYFLRGTDAKGNPIATPMKTTPWEGLNEKGQSFAEAFPTYSFKGKQERPVEGNTIYTDYYYDEKKPLETPSPENKPEDTQEIKNSYEGWRFAPAIGLGMAALSDALGITNNPDYTEAAQIEAATRGGSYMPVSWNPIGNKLTYRPFDRDYYINKLNAEAGATRRALANQSGGNSGRAMAGILAADYNAQDRLGDLFRKSEEYNLEQRQKVEDFNRATNQANSQGELQADMANQQAYASARYYALRGIMAAAEMRQKARMAAEAAKSANLSGFLSALGDIGYENKGMNMVRQLYATGALGPMSRAQAEGFNLVKSKPKKKKSKSLTRK